MSPKILLLDLETSPIITYTWGLFDQNISLNQIKENWHIISFSAKWLGNKEIFYMDQRDNKNIVDDKKMLKSLWGMMNECDILLTQNGVSFDQKKLNAKLIENGFPPYSKVRHIDTLKLAKKHFSFTSNKLEYMSDILCKKFKKLTKRKFQGFDLWKECLAGNKEAWKEMEKYNKMDVLALEELYRKMQPWDNSINFSVYDEDLLQNKCNCGNPHLQKRGYNFSNGGKYQRYRCTSCAAWVSGKENLLSKEKRLSLRK